MHDVNDRRSGDASAGEHFSRFGKRIVHARPRHGAGDIFHLAIDQHEGRIGKCIRRHIGVGYF